jgi:hypothetical protein
MRTGGESGLRDLVAVALGVAVLRFITSQVLLTVRRLAALTRALVD